MPSRQLANAVSEEGMLDEREPVLQEANPSRGPTTGGLEIWIEGSNFPMSLTPLYARFGDNFARVVGTLLISLTHRLIHRRLFESLTWSRACCRERMCRALLPSLSPTAPTPMLLFWVQVSVDLNTSQNLMRCESRLHYLAAAHMYYPGCRLLFVS
jgi:hypothetical protein